MAIPLWTYPVLRRLGGLSGVDAAAVSGHYRSVSAMTFIAATQFLNQVGQSNFRWKSSSRRRWRMRCCSVFPPNSFPGYAMGAYESDIRVLRPGKF